MTNIVLRQPEGKLIRALAPQVGRSSLTFVLLSAITYWVLLQGKHPFTIFTVTQFSLAMVLISALARFGFRATYRLGSDAKRFTVQLAYVLFVIWSGLQLGWKIAGFLAENYWARPAVDISYCALFGTLLFDLLYNFVLDGLSQSKSEPGDGIEKIDQASL